MNAASEFDLGPLTWVKGEIDLALQKAEAALGQFATSADPTQLKFCRTHLHQAHGALAMVALDGVTLITESAEALLYALEDDRVVAIDPAMQALGMALGALRQYLDDLMAGEPNQPLRLLPVLKALAAARGLPEAHPGDLFYPDLTRRPPRQQSVACEIPEDQRLSVLRAERLRFQKGLLSWLTKPEQAVSGLRQMRDVVSAIEQLQPSASTRTFWWVAGAFVDGLSDARLADNLQARQLCSRIDSQIRRLLEGSNHVAERVMREALYHVAQLPAEFSPAVGQAQAVYGLAAMLPNAAVPLTPQPYEAALRRLREDLVAAEEAWNKFCNGTAASLPVFVEAAQRCNQLTEEIGHVDLRRLGQGLGAVANWLAEDAARFGDTVAMEVATSILLLQNAQENFKRLGTDFAQQVDHMVARLYACIAGRPAGDEAIPLLDEMTRRAQEKLLLGQVGREIQNNLAQIEQTLDSFFRDASRAAELVQLDGPLKQISGALAMLGHFGAVACIKDCAARIQGFSAPDYVPDDTDFEAVASELSLVGFFVDALQNGETDFAGFAARMRGEDVVEPALDEPLIAPSVESQLAQQARDTQALVEQLRETPEDERLQAELAQNLEAIQKDADLVANHQLGESAKDALAALQAGAPLDEALTSLTPAAPEVPQPSAETLQLAESTHEVIDAELLAIFLEEAREVLDTMRDQRALLAANPADVEALTTIRRGTHTLKGSGRMVGLTDFGETAWELEQTLNLWLRQDLAADADLQAMIALEHQVFSDWVHVLETGQGLAPDSKPLVAMACRLRGVEPLQVVEPAAIAQVQPETVPEPVIEEIVIDQPLELIDEQSDLPAEAVAEDVIAEAVIEDESIAEALQSDDLQPVAMDSVLPLSPVIEPGIVAANDALADTNPEPSLADDVVRETPILDENPKKSLQTVTISPALFDIFREEAKGHLATLVEHYAVLEANPVLPTAFAMTRAAHTLGGIAGTVGLMPIHHLAIGLEHALLRRDGSGHPDSIEGLETVRQSIMTLQEMFDSLGRQIAPEEQTHLIAALADIYHSALQPEPEPVAEAAGAEVIPLPIAPRLVETVAVTDVVEREATAPALPVLPQLVDELDEQLLPIFLEEAADLTRDMATQLRAWRAEPGGSAAHALARLLHTFKGSARMAGAMNLGEATHHLEARVEEIVVGGAASPAQIDEIEAGCDVLIQSVERLREGPEAVEPAAVEAPATVSPAVEADVDNDAAGQRASLRVRADLIDRLVNDAGELSIARARIEGEMRSLKGSLLELTENVIRLRRQLREIEIQAETQIQARVAHVPEGEAEFDPLELDRFTRFQELTRFMAESVNDVATVQQNLLKNLDDANAAILAQSRLNRSLQQELMGVRMVPFASQTERLYRIVRQTAKETGKRANLDILGGQVDIDRSVLDKMLAPIEHMLRNAVAHGIEGREERLARGKREAGEIVVGLQQEGNEIILSMADDGHGLDAARIRARAESMGLLQPGQVVDDATLHDFIFQPGFSTASELTQLAGRGVGMDVVKTEVAALGGRIEIQTQAGQGTTFRLYLPLTLAVTQTLLVRVGTQQYAVASTMIEQVMEVKSAVLDQVRAQGEVVWQDNHYPFHFLPHLLGDLQAVPEAHRQYWILLLRSGSQRVAVLVDELKGNQEVVVKNIGAQLARVVGIAGATVLGDGRVMLILNPVALANRAGIQPVQAATLAAPIAPELPHQPTVLIVDDSLTVRKITSRLLMREGYHVLLAKDGVDALEQMIDTLPDVILSDIEMPRMDGFDLIRNVRSDERLRGLPMVMITSRTADKHRNYALEIGANHYLGKPYDEVELLGLVAGYCQKR